ncbi:MAG: hypothetical protein LC687_04665 [Actinobacteria bacterium]|nr:hypothetical protein [Actinomycetota bacterium]MCA1807126.1 hypothetical protein [Actinomycetota bacterium]
MSRDIHDLSQDEIIELMKDLRIYSELQKLAREHLAENIAKEHDLNLSLISMIYKGQDVPDLSIEKQEQIRSRLEKRKAIVNHMASYKPKALAEKHDLHISQLIAVYNNQNPAT